MRILFPLAEPVLPGKARFVAIVNTALALARAGAEVKLMLPGPEGAVARYAAAHLGRDVDPRLEVVRIAGWHRALGHPFTWNRLVIAGARRAAARLSAGARTVIHVRHEKVAAALVAQRAAPVVFEAHAIPADYEKERRHGARRAAEAEARTRAILGGADGLAAITDGLLDALVARYGFRGPTSVARSGIDLERFPHQWLARKDDRRGHTPTIVYVGRLGGWKAVPLLVRALARVERARLRIIGGTDDVEKARLQTLARDAGVFDRVEIAGAVPNREVAAILASASLAVHVLPPDLGIAARDTSPLKLLEYLAVGVPIVASDLPSVRELVTHDVTAVLASPGDPAALAAAIRRVLEDSELQERLSTAGRAVAERHDWDARARILLDLHERALVWHTRG